jgi:hypothetical protein
MTYERRHASLVEYLRTSVDAGDWHAVSDAANDLRVLEAQRPQDPKAFWRTNEMPDYIRPMHPAFRDNFPD